MKVLHITSVTHPEGNGVAVAVCNYYKYEKKYIDVAIYNVESNIINDDYSFNFSEYNSISSLPKGFNKPDIVIFNEVYKKKYLELYKECINNNIPYIIIPHGCLTKKSQNHKLLKKVIANYLFFNKFIYNSNAIQFLNEAEKEESVFNHNNFISGNGIFVPQKSNKYVNKDYVYIGRYDIKVKGLDLLVKTVINNRNWFVENNVKIKLFGRDSCNGYKKIKKMINRNNISDILILNGPIYGYEKEKVLLESYAFIQVSRHEGQPMGIMEALSYKIPCIVTYGTSFGNYVNNNRCGIGINFDSSELFLAIKKIFENEKLRNSFSLNASVIEKEYNWDHIIKDCINEYKKLEYLKKY